MGIKTYSLKHIGDCLSIYSNIHTKMNQLCFVLLFICIVIGRNELYIATMTKLFIRDVVLKHDKKTIFA